MTSKYALDLILHAYAVFFLIFWGCKIRVDMPNLLVEWFLWLTQKIIPILIGMIFAFQLYAIYMGWPL